MLARFRQMRGWMTLLGVCSALGAVVLLFVAWSFSGYVGPDEPERPTAIFWVSALGLAVASIVTLQNAYTIGATGGDARNAAMEKIVASHLVMWRTCAIVGVLLALAELLFDVPTP